MYIYFILHFFNISEELIMNTKKNKMTQEENIKKKKIVKYYLLGATGDLAFDNSDQNISKF